MTRKETKADKKKETISTSPHVATWVGDTQYRNCFAISRIPDYKFAKLLTTIFFKIYEILCGFFRLSQIKLKRETTSHLLRRMKGIRRKSVI